MQVKLTCVWPRRRWRVQQTDKDKLQRPDSVCTACNNQASYSYGEINATSSYKRQGKKTDSDVILSPVLPAGMLPSPPLTSVLFPHSLHLAFITLYSTVSCPSFFLPSPWPAKSLLCSYFMFFSQQTLCHLSTSFSSSTQQPSHFSFSLLPFAIHPASHLTFLSSPAWMAVFIPSDAPSLDSHPFFSSDSLSLPPLRFYSPSYFHYHPVSIPLLISSSHTVAQWQTLFMYSAYD